MTKYLIAFIVFLLIHIICYFVIKSGVGENDE